MKTINLVDDDKAKGLNPLDTFVSHDIKDFGAWIPKDINDTKGFDTCSVLHNSQPHLSLENIYFQAQKLNAIRTLKRM
jgi:hypothetical protein